MKIALFGILGLVLVAALVGFFLPTAYKVEREILILVPPEGVHTLVGDLERWPEWTPWAEDDPTIQVTYGDKTTGVGASQTWTGKDGDGELTLTASDPATGIAYDMAFIMDGERAPATCTMTYERKGENTTLVKWSMEGDVADFMPPVVDGYMKLMMPGMISEMFDRGLANLKQDLEGDA